MSMIHENNVEQIGTLFLVGTPIGNLEDMSFRAIEALKGADRIFSEDTRRTMTLLRHFKIEPKSSVESFHDHSSPKVLLRLKRLLIDGNNIAYTTDGGMPVVSDPGFVLVRAANECGARVEVIPGPSASVMLFAASGLPSPKYVFHGFFPRTRGEVEKTLEFVKQTPMVHVFYEAPGRILNSLEIMKRNISNSPMVLGRELTKLHEELLRGTVDEVFSILNERTQVKGECAFAVMGGPIEQKRVLHSVSSEPAPTEGGQVQPIQLTPEQREEISILIKSGVSSKDAAKTLSKKFGVSRRIIYEFIIHHLT